MLLRHLGEGTAADRLEAAMARCLADPSKRTTDLGGALGTRAFTDALIQEITT